MTGFLLTAKQKLMLCINKRLYRSYRRNGSYRRYRSAATVTAAAPVADATSAEDVVERFNELLANLRAAGLLATDNA